MPMLNLYEVKIANMDGVTPENPEPSVYETNVIATDFVTAVQHIEGFLRENHPNDRVVGGGILFENLFVTGPALAYMSELHLRQVMERQKAQLILDAGVSNLVEPVIKGTASPEAVMDVVKRNFPLPEGPSDPIGFGAHHPEFKGISTDQALREPWGPGSFEPDTTGKGLEQERHDAQYGEGQ